MDKREYIQRRRKRYLAQTLDQFEAEIEPFLPESASDVSAYFKAFVRHKFNALAVDAVEIISLDGEVNGAAVDIRDRLYPHASPSRER